MNNPCDRCGKERYYRLYIYVDANNLEAEPTCYDLCKEHGKHLESIINGGTTPKVPRC